MKLYSQQREHQKNLSSIPQKCHPLRKEHFKDPPPTHHITNAGYFDNGDRMQVNNIKDFILLAQLRAGRSLSTSESLRTPNGRSSQPNLINVPGLYAHTKALDGLSMYTCHSSRNVWHNIPKGGITIKVPLCKRTLFGPD